MGKCRMCGKEISSDSRRSKYCSDKCYKDSRKDYIREYYPKYREKNRWRLNLYNANWMYQKRHSQGE